MLSCGHRVISLLLATLIAASGYGQQLPTLTKKAAEVKRKVDRLTPGTRISVIRTDTQEELGTFVSGGPEDFTFYDIDQKSDQTVKYAEVRKIKDGYGGYNSLTQRHTDHAKALVIVIVVAVAVGALIGAAAAAKN